MFENIKAFAFDIDGVFTDGSVLATAEGDLLRTFNSKDCFGVRMAVDNGFPCAIITGGVSQSLIHRAHSLGVKDADLYQLSKDKESDFLHFCEKYGFKPEEVAFVGDDLPDIPAIKIAGLGACPSDAVAEVKSASDYISPYPGGHGCVRDIVEKVAKLQNRWYFNPKEPWKGKHPDSVTRFAGLTGRNIPGTGDSE